MDHINGGRNSIPDNHLEVSEQDHIHERSESPASGNGPADDETAMVGNKEFEAAAERAQSDEAALITEVEPTVGDELTEEGEPAVEEELAGEEVHAAEEEQVDEEGLFVNEELAGGEVQVVDGEQVDEEGHVVEGESEAAYEDDGEELSRIIEELCLSKAEEFAMLGYDGVTGKDIWEFVSEQYDKTGIPPLHRLINDILSLRVTNYMNWLTLSAYKGMKFTE